MDTAKETQQLDASLEEQSFEIEIPTITPFRPIPPSSKPADPTIPYEEGKALSTLDKFIISAIKLGPKFRKQASLATKLDSQIQGDRRQLKQLKRKFAEASKSPETTSPTPASEITKAAEPTTGPAPPPPPPSPPPQPKKSSPPSLDGEQLAQIREKFRYEYRYVAKPKYIFRPIAPRDGPSLLQELYRRQRKVARLTAMKSVVKKEIVAFERCYETAAATDDEFPVLMLSAVPYRTSADIYSDHQRKIGVVERRLQAERKAKEWAKKFLAGEDYGLEE